MNLPEYREALNSAQRRFASVIQEAAEVLTEELHKADCAFFEEQPKMAEPEEYERRRRG